jgi:C-terminal processing protease CtpA/Prc
MKRAIVEKVVSELNACYIDPETAGRIERLLRQREAAGRYDRLRDLTPFLQTLRSDLRSVADDAHLGVWPIWYAPVPLDTSALAVQRWREEQRRDNYGFGRVEVLPDDIGYLELTRFARPSVGETTARAAMAFLAGVDALIIDVRENHGGSEDMVNLICAYLFEEPVHTISFYTRYTGETRDLWTPADVRGSALAHIPVFVLQSEESASAAEHLAYALQAAGRARIVGERSRGAANPVEERVYPELSLNISLPVSRAIHPLTGTSWEGVGVKPDVETAATDALEIALRLAREHLRPIGR